VIQFTEYSNRTAGVFARVFLGRILYGWNWTHASFHLCTTNRTPGTAQAQARYGDAHSVLLGCGQVQRYDPVVSETDEDHASPAEPVPNLGPTGVADLAPHFPHLEVLDVVGSGGCGSVYRARQITLDRHVALKVLSDTLAQDEIFVSRFRREARTLAALDHPNIVKIHDAGQAGPYLYLLMEYVDGTNLRACMRETRLNTKQTLRVVIDICVALQFSHDAGIVHRDLKPENILLDSKGRVKIADFGLVKLVGRDATSALTRVTQVMGTPQYMAPEQYEAPSKIDHRADLYALGVVLYELLTGELPLGHFQPPSEMADVDVRLDRIVMRALEKDRDRRYQSADEIQTDVADISLAKNASHGTPHTNPGAREKGWAGTWKGLIGMVGAGSKSSALPIVGTQSGPFGQRVDLVNIGPDTGGVLSALVETTNCSNSEAKKALKQIPFRVAERVNREQAQWIRSRLEAFGAEVEII
jgi:serine/threonine protein kinase